MIKLKETRIFRIDGVELSGRLLDSMDEALGSICSTKKKDRKERGGRKEREEGKYFAQNNYKVYKTEKVKK
jgi:hypothetical protein